MTQPAIGELAELRRQYENLEEFFDEARHLGARRKDAARLTRPRDGGHASVGTIVSSATTMPATVSTATFQSGQSTRSSSRDRSASSAESVAMHPR